MGNNKNYSAPQDINFVTFLSSRSKTLWDPVVCYCLQNVYCLFCLSQTEGKPFALPIDLLDISFKWHAVVFCAGAEPLFA